LDVLGGANQGIDKLTVENKLEVALYYTTRLRVTGADYAIDEIVSILNNVTSDYASVISAKAAIEALL
jgi:hypothetical protein